MSKTVIYIIRHGESEANQRDAFLGHTDLDLTEKGRIQAENTARYLSDVHFDAIYSSDLSRAFHTAEYTAREKGLEIIKNKGVREINAGVWENVTFSELEAEYPTEYGTWVKDLPHARCVGGESVVELAERVIPEFEKLARDNVGRTIAIFSHGTPIRILKNHWDGKSLDRLLETPWASNASVTRAEYENGVFRVTDYSIDDFHGDLVTKLPDNV